MVLSKLVKLLAPPKDSRDSDLKICKELILRLLYGGNLLSWMKAFNVNFNSLGHGISAQLVGDWIQEGDIPQWHIDNGEDQSENLLLLQQLLHFPTKLEAISRYLLKNPKYEHLHSAFFSSARSHKKKTLRSWMSIVLQDIEKEILLFADRSLAKMGRQFDVLIHDGGLIRRADNEMDFPHALLCQLNGKVSDEFQLQFVEFAFKPFETSLANDIMSQIPFFPEYNYYQWKHYLENHRDLCYFTKDNTFFFADNIQTNIYKSKEALKTAMAKYSISGTHSNNEPEYKHENNENSVGDGTPTSNNKQSILSSPARSENQIPIFNNNKKSTPFFEIWIKDPVKREFDIICFSEKTQPKEKTHLSHLTPIDHAEKYNGRIRYVFQGWDLLYAQMDDESSPALFLTLMNNIFPDFTSRKYMIDWIAHIFQFPDSRIVGTCVALISKEQGTGKTTLMDALLSLMTRYGRKITKPQEELFNNFTNAMEFNILLAIDDSRSDAMRDNYEELKNLITSDEARIRELYVSERQVITNARFLIVSNNMEILKLEENSRRFAVFEPADSLLMNYQFFHKFESYWSKIGNRKATLLYFLNHTISEDWHPEKSYPLSTLKKQMECSNLSLVALYAYALARTLREHKDKTSDYFDVNSTQLFEKLKLWISVNYPKAKNEETPTRKSFRTLLMTVGIRNTKDLDQQQAKRYKEGEYYRIPLKKFAEKANHYFIEGLTDEFVIQGGYPVDGNGIVLRGGLLPSHTEQERLETTTTTKNTVTVSIDPKEVETAIHNLNWTKLLELGLITKDFLLLDKYGKPAKLEKQKPL